MRRCCPLESRRKFWDNRHAVNTSKRLLSSLLFLSLAAAGCEKSANLGSMRDETLAIVKLHARDIEVLQRRADGLMVRGRNLGGGAPGIAEAGRYLSEARSGLDQLRSAVTQAPMTLETTVKSNDLEQVTKATDELIEKLDTLEEGVRANLAAVDTWLMTAENRPSVATPVTPPATHDAASAPASDAGSAAAPTTPPAPPAAAHP